MDCDILKSKLIVCEWNAFYFIGIGFIGFSLDEIKQCIVFFGTPGTIVLLNSNHFSWFVYTTCKLVLYFLLVHRLS